MQVNTQTVNFNADGKLLDFAQKRMEKLELFYDRIVRSEVFMKVQKTSLKENKVVEVKVHIPKDTFIVKKRCKTFEEAIDSACNSLERKLVKKKTKPKVQNPLKIF